MFYVKAGGFDVGKRLDLVPTYSGDGWLVICGDSRRVLSRVRKRDFVDAIVTDPPSGTKFMYEDWDDDKGGRDQWVAWLSSVMKKALLWAKPGAHALVWATPRTSHWTATALEDAGFEVRDVISVHYGHRHPKGLDISKAIDAMHGAEPTVVATEQRTGLATGVTRTVESGAADALVGVGATAYDCKITVPTTEDAKRWDDFHTNLRPLTEHWILCRKPLAERSVAAQVLATDTGALNIGACRKPTTDRLTRGRAVSGQAPKKGRWPGNVVFCHHESCGDVCAPECPVVGMDAIAGKAVSKFFYAVRTSTKERAYGLPDGMVNTHPCPKPIDLMRYLCRLITPPRGVVLDVFAGTGTTGIACLQEGFSFIGIDNDEYYVDMCRTRLAYCVKETHA